MIDAVGASCVGGFNNFPVLGAKEAPSLGNGNFAMELYGAAPSARMAWMIGITRNAPPIDLSVIGIQGCNLLVQPLLTLPGSTTAGNAQRAEGTATLPLGIPNDSTLRGTYFDVQAVIVDANVSRTLTLALTNALGVTIQ